MGLLFIERFASTLWHFCKWLFCQKIIFETYFGSAEMETFINCEHSTNITILKFKAALGNLVSDFQYSNKRHPKLFLNGWQSH